MGNVLITPPVTAFVLIAYALLMILSVKYFTRREGNRKEYLIANRKLSIFRGASSIAVSWIWAPAIFFCAVKAYTQGLPGAFWFIVPNVVCFATFAIVALNIRKQYDHATSLPDYFIQRFKGHRGAHIASLTVMIGIDVVALLFNTFIGSFLLNLLSGIPILWGMVIMMGIALIYSVWRGLPASVVTDIIQLAVIFLIAFLLVPWVIIKAGGFQSIIDGLGGKTGEFKNIFNASVAYSFGIPSTLALLSVPLADQMFYQRAMACPTKTLMKTFLLGGLLFGIVPIVLSIFGFIAAGSEMTEVLSSKQFPLILVNVEVVKHFLPAWTLIGFVFLAISALSSTLDSALCALGSIWGQDIYGRYIKPNASDSDSIKSIRISVIVIGISVMILAILLRNQLSGDVLFNFNGIVASAIVPGIILTVFWKKTKAIAITVGTIVALIIGIPFGWWANVGLHVHGIEEMVNFVVLAAIGTPIISTILVIVISLFTNDTVKNVKSE